VKWSRLSAARAGGIACSLLALAAIATAAPTPPPTQSTDEPHAAAQGKAAAAIHPVDRRLDRGQILAREALSYRGAHYRFGGTSRNGIDCSGLTQAVYRQYGLKLPRTSTDQFRKGIPVAKADLRPGDLVFFKNTYRHGISHVGIYVGEGKFVHAAGVHKGVIVGSLDSAYHRNHFAGARRLVLDHEPEVSASIKASDPIEFEDPPND